MEFKQFKTAVAKQFQSMRVQDTPMFFTKADKDAMWNTYLDSFPEGTNPVYRERREYDCSACRQFIRAVGNVVVVKNNELVSIWDIAVDEPAFQIVADAMSRLVKANLIENIFLSTEPTAGVDKNYEQLTEGVQAWEHFYVRLPHSVIVRGEQKGTMQSEARANKEVLLRSLQELTDDAVETVLDLIAQNSLYRGEEHKGVVQRFKEVKQKFREINAEDQADNFAWVQSVALAGPVAKIRNTSIGTLLVDLSIGTDLEEAVRKYEAVVAPANYKRPTALVTQAMVEKAREKVEVLGLISALGRRYAQMSDICVNDILYVDRDSKKNLGGDVFDDIAASVPDKRGKGSYDKVEEVPIEKFLKDVMPTATSFEVMVENPHTKNLFSLVAPTDPTAGLLFKWGNNFSWAYNGDMADSIKEKVKASGGNVTGDLCCRLAWYNFDDLDLHMVEPTGEHIYYGNKVACGTGGQLDVDMNAGGTRSREPIENIFYGSKARMKEGIYLLYVNQYNQRESKDVGFEIEIDFMGDILHFAYDKVVKGSVTVATFEYSHKDGIKIIESLPSSSVTKEVWGLQTNKFHKVNLVMLSPNHWESSGTGVGNKHYFFVLEGCLNPDSARGFFNEFLSEKLNEHRKVFEIIGGKMKTEPSNNQLSGLGFSSTVRNHVLCRVTGAFNRVIKIVF